MSTIGYNKNRMIAASRLREDASLHLPPPDVWLFTPGQDEPMPTPIDDRGLVDADALIALVKSTVIPDFAWPSYEKSDPHHLYWAGYRYPKIPNASVCAHEFRNLPINQIVVPRMFHSWIHLTTKEPPVPTEEVMKYRIEAYKVVRRLFRNAKQSIDLTCAPYMPEDKLRRGSEHHLWEFLVEVEEAQKLPAEFHPINFSELDPSTPEELRALTGFLGRAVARASRARDVRSNFARGAFNAAGATLVV